MQGPIKTKEKFEATLQEVYLLLQKNIRLNTVNYVKLGCYCILISHYAQTRMDEVSENVIAIYDKIRQLLAQKKKQEMLIRLGLYIIVPEVEDKGEYSFSRHVIKLSPEIIKGNISGFSAS